MARVRFVLERKDSVKTNILNKHFVPALLMALAFGMMHSSAQTASNKKVEAKKADASQVLDQALIPERFAEFAAGPIFGNAAGDKKISRQVSWRRLA